MGMNGMLPGDYGVVVQGKLRSQTPVITRQLKDPPPYTPYIPAIPPDTPAVPQTPGIGKRWLVPKSPTPTGDWAGHGTHIAEVIAYNKPLVVSIPTGVSEDGLIITDSAVDFSAFVGYFLRNLVTNDEALILSGAGSGAVLSVAIKLSTLTPYQISGVTYGFTIPFDGMFVRVLDEGNELIFDGDPLVMDWKFLIGYLPLNNFIIFGIDP
jgi:hypothetical protein